MFYCVSVYIEICIENAARKYKKLLETAAYSCLSHSIFCYISNEVPKCKDNKLRFQTLIYHF